MTVNSGVTGWIDGYQEKLLRVQVGACHWRIQDAWSGGKLVGALQEKTHPKGNGTEAKPYLGKASSQARHLLTSGAVSRNSELVNSQATI